MKSWHNFFDNWNIKEYLADESREKIAGYGFTALREKVNQFEQEGYELLHIRTLGGIWFRTEEKPLVLHQAEMHAYRTSNYGDVFAKVFVIPVKSVTTDANSNEVFESVTEEGEKIYFVIQRIPGSPEALGRVDIKEPRFL